MAPKYLVNEDIERGRSLIRKLDDQGVRFQAALWAYNPESARYQLVFGSDDVDSEGARRLYRQIQEALEALPPEQRVPFPDIAVSSMSTGVVAHLRTAVSTPSDAIESHRFTDEVVDRELVEDALVYRMSATERLPDSGIGSGSE
jgi:hypothetical protein